MFFTKFTLLLFTFLTVSCSSSANDFDFHSFCFTKFDKNSPRFASQISLLGHSTLNASTILINSGSVLYRNPFLLFDSNPTRLTRVSFTTYFVFSLPPETRHGHGSLSFVLRTNRSVDPGFSLTLDHLDLKQLNNGKKLQCWIDFESGLGRVEVRVSKLGGKRPVSPLISRDTKLVNVFGKNKVYMSLESWNTTRVCRLYSWSFKLRRVQNWMHSQPLDPQGFKKDAKQIAVVVPLQKRNDCLGRVFAALVFGTGCGALGAFIVLCVCRVFVAKKPASASVSPEELVVQPVVFDCDKVKVIVVDKCDTVKK